MRAMLDRLILIGAALAAVAIPASLLSGGEPPSVAVQRLNVLPPPPEPAEAVEVAVLERPLFEADLPAVAASDASTAAVETAASPELIGIVGRLPNDAIALVRAADGRSRSLRTGQSYEGWRLASLSADAAVFIRGGERLRVALDLDS